MALNENRIFYTRLVAVTAGLLALLVDHEWAQSLWLWLLQTLGVGLVGLCALGRLYCTAFLGGHKNQTLVTAGPFSVCRNPLYGFSLLGALGVACLSGYVTLILCVPVVMWVVYWRLIAREEAFLRQTFGAAYDEYCRRTPRLWPRLAAYEAPETVTAAPRQLLSGLRDALVWFSAPPIFYGLDMAHQGGVLPTIFHLW
jgi:protein-S-isoprenylcysteine O-methyltransferase Ste14